MTSDPTQLAALSRLFSPSVFREMATKGRSGLFARLLPQAGIVGHQAGETVASTFDVAFAAMRRSGIRNEYVYRAALTHNVLLGRHSLNTASMLTEFRIGSSKADMVILNGTGTVYEIKSDRDSLARLKSQIADYSRAFARVCVIAGEAHIKEALEGTPEHVGVLSLARWNRIQTVREPIDRFDQICPLTVFDSLRAAEARAILRDLNVSVPNVPNTLLRARMRECFRALQPTELHHAMVQTLRCTRDLSSLRTLVSSLPRSLKPVALSVRVRRTDHKRLINAMGTSISTALAWG